MSSPIFPYSEIKGDYIMITDDTLVSVRNRDRGTVGYTLDTGVHRSFSDGEVKKITLGELRTLSYKPGGQVLLDQYLVVEDQEALAALNMTVEPEYFYDEKTIRELLFAADNLDAFADFIDFAPEGAIDIAKDIAVKEQIPDTRKRKLLSEKTGLNIDMAIKVNEIIDGPDTAEAEAPKQRRVQVEAIPAAAIPQRRTAAPQYKVVSKN